MTARACTHWLGSEHRCCQTQRSVRHYLTGWRCPAHTPAALAGHPEPPPGPGMPTGAWTTPSPHSDSRAHPNPHRAAQAAVNDQEVTT
ncbi:hypothetical protein [Streptomyces sp. CC224B]|uniref:hypothetical protein n=1 Tax=Streptomyces sp. CC224B TaxID=3044571 RepID=UPI0024A808C6|nr:hypothetical protein [Streptomyces sp. CC224B]